MQAHRSVCAAVRTSAGRSLLARRLLPTRRHHHWPACHGVLGCSLSSTGCRSVEAADPGSARVVTLPLTGDWVQVEGFNANGIAETPNRKALLVVNSATGLLYRVDPETGQATEVDLGGNSLPNGDGLLVRGRTLYVVQNQDNQVAVFKLNAAGTAGQLVDTLTSDDFDIPTTVAAFGNSLYLPNARFNTPPTPDTPYWITRIDRRS